MSNVNLRKENLYKNVKQIISWVNICPEDYLNPEDTAKMCRDANLEMIEIIKIKNNECLGQYIFKNRSENTLYTLELYEYVEKDSNIFKIINFVHKN